eukprot:2973701-Prymnesium_polylepis.1
MASAVGCAAVGAAAAVANAVGWTRRGGARRSAAPPRRVELRSEAPGGRAWRGGRGAGNHDRVHLCERAPVRGALLPARQHPAESRGGCKCR